MKWIGIEKRLRSSGVEIFTGREFQRITKVSPVAAKFLLMRYTDRGALCRLKRDFYALPSRMPSPWAIANRIYRPSYISLQSALSYHGLIPETVYAVTSITTKSTREFEAQGMTYLYRTIKRKAFTGYRAVEINEETVLLAEKEKALADYLYFVYLKKEALNDRLKIRSINKRRLLEHTKTFGLAGFFDWVKYDLKISN